MHEKKTIVNLNKRRHMEKQWYQDLWKHCYTVCKLVSSIFCSFDLRCRIKHKEILCFICRICATNQESTHSSGLVLWDITETSLSRYLPQSPSQPENTFHYDFSQPLLTNELSEKTALVKTTRSKEDTHVFRAITLWSTLTVENNWKWTAK